VARVRHASLISCRLIPDPEELARDSAAPRRDAARRPAGRAAGRGGATALDFLDAHERRALAEHQGAIGRINALLETRGQAPARLEKLLRDE